MDDEAVDVNAAADAEFGAAPVTATQSCPQQAITVTVRRDFPIRETEKFGAWQWRTDGGDRCLFPLLWSLPGDAACSAAVDLRPSRPDPVTGWGLGHPELRRPGDPGGGYTTDTQHPIQAEVRLLQGGTVQTAARTTGQHGLATLSTVGLSGDFLVEIVPDDRVDDDMDVGPRLNARDGCDLLYRPLRVEIQLRDGALTRVDDPYDPITASTHGRVGNRRAWGPSTVELPISLKPIWWRHPGAEPRQADIAIDMAIIHCTSGARLGNALQEWFESGSKKGPHYVVDIDGHIIKLVSEDKRISHVRDPSDRWERQLHPVSNNDRSVGVEIINPIALGGYTNADAYMASNTAQPYTPEQYSAVIALGQALVRAYQDIAHRIIGHSDVACGPVERREDGEHATPVVVDTTPPDRYGTRRRFDPGDRFCWERLELAAPPLGMKLLSPFNEPGMYDDLFATFPDIVLREGDRDGHGARHGVLGGENRPGYTGAPIARLKADLRYIGFSLRNVDGRFDAWTSGAVDRFQRHFFSGGRRRPGSQRRVVYGRVDAATAWAIRNIASSIPPPSPPRLLP